MCVTVRKLYQLINMFYITHSRLLSSVYTTHILTHSDHPALSLFKPTLQLYVCIIVYTNIVVNAIMLLTKKLMILNTSVFERDNTHTFIHTVCVCVIVYSVCVCVCVCVCSVLVAWPLGLFLLSLSPFSFVV